MSKIWLPSFVTIVALGACQSVPAPTIRPPTDRVVSADQEPDSPPSPTQPDRAEAAADPNRIGLFTGVTNIESSQGLAIGVEYERRLGDLVGVGGIIEYTPDLFDRRVTTPALWVHPFRGLSLPVAVGLQEEESHNALLFRIGAAYDIDLGKRFSIAPAINFDFVYGPDNNVIVYGLVLSRSF